MQNYKVKDLMVPLGEYATVMEGGTLFEAVQALEKAQEAFDHLKYRHRGVLIVNRKGMVIGKLSHLDALRALEPVPNDVRTLEELSQLGFSDRFVRDIRRRKRMQTEPLKGLCQRAQTLKVEDFMQATAEGECINQEASLDLAIHQLVFGNHNALLATEHDHVVGILRLADVFAAVFHSMQACAAD